MLRTIMEGSAALATGFFSGCTSEVRGEGSGQWITTFGRKGISDGRFSKPRAITIDKDDNVYIVDLTARIQVFDRDFKFVRVWETPVHDNGRPTGLSIGNDGTIIVPDTHYYRVLFYSPQGELLDKVGGTRGMGPGQFHFLTDAVQAKDGTYFFSEYGDFDRIHKYDADKKFIKMWGGHGDEQGKFQRPQAMAFDDKQQLWVADSCNHRIQIFSREGDFIRTWGQDGKEPGKLSYPYGILFDPDWNFYVCEFGNHRVQKFDREGKSVGWWGSSGTGPEQMNNPWSMVRDSQGRLIVLDSLNHRVHVIRL